MKDLFNVQQLSQFEFGAIIVTILIAGLVFGCLLAYALLRRKDGPKVAAAEALKEEFEEYKDKVDDHFNTTSEMFKDVTTQYKKLYDHMAVGAIELSKADTITMPRLEMQDTQEAETAADENIIDETSVDASVDSVDASVDSVDASVDSVDASVDSVDASVDSADDTPADESAIPVESQDVASHDSDQADDHDDTAKINETKAS